MEENKCKWCEGSGEVIDSNGVMGLCKCRKEETLPFDPFARVNNFLDDFEGALRAGKSDGDDDDLV